MRYIDAALQWDTRLEMDDRILTVQTFRFISRPLTQTDSLKDSLDALSPNLCVISL